MIALALLLAAITPTTSKGSCQGATDSSLTCTITLGAASTNGNDMVVGISAFDGDAGKPVTVASVVDSGGSTYSQRGSTATSGAAHQQGLIYAAHGVTTSTTITVTMTCNGGSGCIGCTGSTGCIFLGVAAQEYSGVGTYGNTNTGLVTTANTAASIAVTTQAANNFIVGFSTNDATGTITTSAGTQRVTNAGGVSDAVTISDITNASPGSLTITWSGPSATWTQNAVELCGSNPCVAAGAQALSSQRGRRGAGR